MTGLMSKVMALRAVRSAWMFVAAAMLMSAVADGVAAQQGGVAGRGSQAGAPQTATRTITQVTPNLYKVNTGPAVAPVTVVLVTGEGIVLADPISPEVSAWLRDELAKRFPGK